ncbi:MAG: hypothetical protein IT289_13125 [Oligoflexia bacterium]|nr:hypothetical protein [Oligoflexia bacterium]
MSRQIHPGLFGSMENQPLGAEVLPLFESVQAGPTAEELNQAIEKVRFEAESAAKSASLRAEKLTQKVMTLEDRLRQVSGEINDRLVYLAARLKDKGSVDGKVEALLERHNQVVQSFELKLSQATRLIENQALQIARYQEALDEARRQLEKLKRI